MQNTDTAIAPTNRFFDIETQTLNPNIGSSQHESTHIASAIRRLGGEYISQASATLTLLCDAAASTLSYSAAFLINSSSTQRAIASGAAWAASSLFSALDHSLLSSKRMPNALLSDAMSFGAGTASLSAAVLSQQTKPQEVINRVSILSNSLWIASGLLSNVSLLKNEHQTPCETAVPSILKTANVLTSLAGLSNALAGGFGIASTVDSNGSNVQFNQLSSNFWMTASLLNTIATVLRVQMAKTSAPQAPDSGTLSGRE